MSLLKSITSLTSGSSKSMKAFENNASGITQQCNNKSQGFLLNTVIDLTPLGIITIDI